MDYWSKWWEFSLFNARSAIAKWLNSNWLCSAATVKLVLRSQILVSRKVDARKIINELQNGSNVFLDKSRDCSTKEQMSLIFQYVSHQSGEVKEMFLAILDCSKDIWRNIASLIMSGTGTRFTQMWRTRLHWSLYYVRSSKCCRQYYSFEFPKDIYQMK